TCRNHRSSRTRLPIRRAAAIPPTTSNRAQHRSAHDGELRLPVLFDIVRRRFEWRPAVPGMPTHAGERARLELQLELEDLLRNVGRRPAYVARNAVHRPRVDDAHGDMRGCDRLPAGLGARRDAYNAAQVAGTARQR